MIGAAVDVLGVGQVPGVAAEKIGPPAAAADDARAGGKGGIELVRLLAVGRLAQLLHDLVR